MREDGGERGDGRRERKWRVEEGKDGERRARILGAMSERWVAEVVGEGRMGGRAEEREERVERRVSMVAASGKWADRAWRESQARR